MYTSQTISKMFLILSYLGFLNAECNAETKGPQSSKAITSHQTFGVQSEDISKKVRQKHQPEGVCLETVMAAFYTTNNNSAFKKGDQAKLIVGSTLIVPSAQALGPTIPLKIDSQLGAPLREKMAVSNDNSSTLSSHTKKDATESVADNV